MVSYDGSNGKHVNHSNNNKRDRESSSFNSTNHFNMDREHQIRGGHRVKKITCEDCKGGGHIKIENTIEPCASCNANGYHIYIEEEEAFGNDCKKGQCDA